MLWLQIWKCSAANTEVAFSIFPFQCDPSDIELHYLLLWHLAFLITIKGGWMCQGVNTPGADLTQHLMALCVYIPSFSNSKVCVHSPPPPRVFQLDLASLPHWRSWPGHACFITCRLLFPVHFLHSLFSALWTFSRTTWAKIIVSGVCFWGNPNKDMLRFCPDSQAFSLWQKNVQYAEKATAKWETKYRFFKELGKHPMLPSAWWWNARWGKWIQTEGGFMRSPEAIFCLDVLTVWGWKATGSSTQGCRPLKHSHTSSSECGSD